MLSDNVGPLPISIDECWYFCTTWISFYATRLLCAFFQKECSRTFEAYTVLLDIKKYFSIGVVHFHTEGGTKNKSISTVFKTSTLLFLSKSVAEAGVHMTPLVWSSNEIRTATFERFWPINAGNVWRKTFQMKINSVFANSSLNSQKASFVIKESGCKLPFFKLTSSSRTRWFFQWCASHKNINLLFWYIETVLRGSMCKYFCQHWRFSN